MAKIASLVVKLGGLIVILGFPQTYAIVLQLLGGIWICQTLPAVMLGLYTRWLHPWALLIGWAVGIASGTWMASTLSFKSATYVLHMFGVALPCYAAISALVLNCRQREFEHRLQRRGARRPNRPNRSCRLYLDVSRNGR